VASADELQFGYAFGKTSAADQEDSEPAEAHVVERKQFLAALNARLSPQARRVASMVVNTDETETLARSHLDVGAALATGRNIPSDRTLMRHGQKAIDDAAKEIGALLQELAA
jgi:hypothetical protein